MCFGCIIRGSGSECDLIRRNQEVVSTYSVTLAHFHRGETVYPKVTLPILYAVNYHRKYFRYLRTDGQYLHGSYVLIIRHLL